MNDHKFAIIMVVFFAGGFVLGALLSGDNHIYELGIKAKELIENCESSLLRSQFCEPIAKPEGE